MPPTTSRREYHPGNQPCHEVQLNRHAPDFRCGITGPGHVVHIDPATGTRWGHPAVPRGMRRKVKKV